MSKMKFVFENIYIVILISIKQSKVQVNSRSMAALARISFSILPFGRERERAVKLSLTLALTAQTNMRDA